MWSGGVLAVSAAAWPLQQEQVAKGSGGAQQAAAGGGGYAVFALFGAVAAVGWLALLRARIFRVPPGVGPAMRLSPMLCIAGFAGALIIGTMAATATAGLADDADAMARTTLAAIASSAAQMAWLWAVTGPLNRAPGGSLSAPEPGTAPVPARIGMSLALLVSGSILALPGVFLVGAIASALERLWSGTPPELAHRTLQQLASEPQHGLWWWLTVANAALVAPCVEELLFRGLAQQGLKSAGFRRPVAVLASAAFFALLHWNAVPEAARWSGLLMIACLGVFWGWLYERTGRLSMSIAGHVLFNAGTLLYLAAR